MHLTKGNTVGHHNIRRCMRTREEILDFLAGFNVPIRNPALFQRINDLRLNPSSLTDILHRFKGQKRLNPLMDQIHHNIITSRNSIAQCRYPLTDQLLCIIQPYIRTM